MKKAVVRFGSFIDNEKSIWAVLLVGLILRCISIATRGIQYDDAFTILLARQSLSNIITGTIADTMPPLFYWLLHFWMAISGGIWFMRLLTIGLNLATVYVFYRLVVLLFDRPAAFWAALLAAIAPIQLYHAQDIRMYALLLLAQTTYTLFFVRIWKKSSVNSGVRWDWFGLIVSGAVAMYTHNLAIFALAIPDLFLLVKKEWALLKRLIAAQLLVGLIALPWLIELPAQFSKVQRAWSLSRPGLVDILQSVIMFTGTLPLSSTATVIVAVLSVQIIVLISIETFRWLRKMNADVFLVACYAVLPPLILFALSYVIKPMFVPRAFLISSLAYYALAGFIITRRTPRVIGPLIAAAFILAVSFSLPSFYSFDEFPRSQFRQAAEYLSSVSEPGDIIVHDNKLSYFPSYVYSADLNQVFLPDQPGSPNDTLAPQSQTAMGIFPVENLESAVSGYNRIYFIVFQQTIDDYIALGEPNHPNLLWLDEHYQQNGVITFGDLLIYVYEF